MTQQTKTSKEFCCIETEIRTLLALLERN